MTRKDFNLLATRINRLMPTHSTKMFVWEEMVKLIADTLEAQYPRFDHAKFMTACKGKKDGE